MSVLLQPRRLQVPWNPQDWVALRLSRDRLPLCSSGYWLQHLQCSHLMPWEEGQSIREMWLPKDAPNWVKDLHAEINTASLPSVLFSCKMILVTIQQVSMLLKYVTFILSDQKSQKGFGLRYSGSLPVGGVEACFLARPGSGRNGLKKSLKLETIDSSDAVAHKQPASYNMILLSRCSRERKNGMQLGPKTSVGISTLWSSARLHGTIWRANQFCSPQLQKNRILNALEGISKSACQS